MALRVDRFWRDDRAQTPIEVFSIFLVVVVPLGLFIALLVYLRRFVAGAPPLPEDAAPAEPEPAVESKVAGARRCRRCGVEVRPTRGPMGVECPNCGAGMA